MILKSSRTRSVLNLKFQTVEKLIVFNKKTRGLQYQSYQKRWGICGLNGDY